MAIAANARQKKRGKKKCPGKDRIHTHTEREHTWTHSLVAFSCFTIYMCLHVTELYVSKIYRYKELCVLWAD